MAKPFIKTAAVPYRIVLGDDATAKAYGIVNMPDTFLIDRDGRIATAYMGMVDRNNIAKTSKYCWRRHSQSILLDWAEAGQYELNLHWHKTLLADEFISGQESVATVTWSSHGWPKRFRRPITTS